MSSPRPTAVERWLAGATVRISAQSPSTDRPDPLSSNADGAQITLPIFAASAWPLHAKSLFPFGFLAHHVQTPRTF